MRYGLIALALGLSCLTDAAWAQPRPNPGARARVVTPESLVKQAAESLANDRKSYERDNEVLRHLRVADDALADPMQPTIAVQKGYEELLAAKRLSTEFTVTQGLIAVERVFEQARLSPGTADFGKLRIMLRQEAIGPASRVVVRNASAIGEEIASWLRVQEMIAAHLRSLSDITAQSLKAAEQ